MIRVSQIQTARALCAAPAALAGGAWFARGRGCGYLAALRSALLPCALLPLALLPLALLPLALLPCDAAAGGAVTVPSGQVVTLDEVRLESAPGQPGQTWARFRFLAPQIARDSGSVTHEAAASDMDHLCGALALPYLAERGMAAARVVISLSDRAVPFGVQDPAATQFFEAYRPEGPACIWEAF